MRPRRLVALMPLLAMKDVNASHGAVAASIPVWRDERSAGSSFTDFRVGASWRITNNVHSNSSSGEFLLNEFARPVIVLCAQARRLLLGIRALPQMEAESLCPASARLVAAVPGNPAVGARSTAGRGRSTRSPIPSSARRAFARARTVRIESRHPLVFSSTMCIGPMRTAACLPTKNCSGRRAAPPARWRCSASQRGDGSKRFFRGCSTETLPTVAGPLARAQEDAEATDAQRLAMIPSQAPTGRRSGLRIAREAGGSTFLLEQLTPTSRWITRKSDQDRDRCRHALGDQRNTLNFSSPTT